MEKHKFVAVGGEFLAHTCSECGCFRNSANHLEEQTCAEKLAELLSLQRDYKTEELELEKKG